MAKCVRITVLVKKGYTKLQSNIQTHAKVSHIEGSLYQDSSSTKENIKIIACGQSNDIDIFLDEVHKEIGSCIDALIEVEPYNKDKDYRGVFRIIA